MLRLELILIVGIIYLIWDNFFKKKTPEEKKQLEIDKELNESKLTYKKSQYYTFADSLESAMENATTDEQTIYNVFQKLENDNDFLMLEKAFGKRIYTGEVFGVITGAFDFTEGNSLEQWLHFELSDDEIKQVNSILKKNKITYKI